MTVLLTRTIARWYHAFKGNVLPIEAEPPGSKMLSPEVLKNCCDMRISELVDPILKMAPHAVGFAVG